MSDSSGRISIAITPMHSREEGIWEAGPREGAQLFLVELVEGKGEGEEAAVVVECRDEPSAALAARVAAATVAALGLAEPEALRDDSLFDGETARILRDNPSPGVEPPSGEWRPPEE
jgi:hypothetical protein